MQRVLEIRTAFWLRKEAWQRQFEDLCVIDILTRKPVDIDKVSACMTALVAEIVLIEVCNLLPVSNCT